MKKEITKKTSMEELSKDEAFGGVATYANNKTKFKLPKKKLARNPIQELQKLEEEFNALNPFNKLKNKKLNTDTERMAILLNESLIHVIQYMNKEANYDSKWIKQLFSLYESTVGNKGDYTIHDKVFFAHFIEIMELNNITKRQAMILLRHFFGLSESQAKRINKAYKDNKSEYLNSSSRYLIQMEILQKIMGEGLKYKLALCKGLLDETIDNFEKMISDTLNFYREKINNKVFKRRHLDFFQIEENELVINYINQDYIAPIDFLGKLTNNINIQTIRRNLEKHSIAVQKSEAALVNELRNNGYSTDNLDMETGSNEDQIKELYEERKKQKRESDIYEQKNMQHLLLHREFNYQLGDLLERIEQNLFPEKY